MASRSLPGVQFSTNSRGLPSSIPLNCNICAKRPTFSDVSHLLTHIASKGHLSTYYKIKVRAGQEEDSRRLIEDYDTWYATWNIEYLMSGRMNIKDQKKNPRKRQSTNNDDSSRSASVVPSRRSYTIDPSMDPRLVNQGIKTESALRSATPYVDPAFLQNSYVLPAQSWFTMPYGYSTVPLIKQEKSDYSDVAIPSSDYSPTPSRTSRPSRAGISSSYADDYDLDDGLENDANKLKGVLWPGMNMFDAATPDMRRKRNQKKAISVVEQLEATSKEIDATELVFSPSGTLRRARHISGFPNIDSSPLKGEESPPPKVEKRSRRTALAEKDPNIVKRSRKTAKKQPNPYHASKKSIDVDDDEEADEVMSYPPPRKMRPKRKAKVLFDEDADDVGDVSTKALREELCKSTPARPSVGPEDFLMPRATAPAQFRPAGYAYIDGEQHYGANMSRYGDSTMTETATMVSAWDFLGQDLVGPFDNPLYTETYPRGLTVADHDDDETISVVTSQE